MEFIDWESNVNSYFRWYHMDDDLCAEYADTRLGGQAKIFSENECIAAKRRGRSIMSLVEMALKLQSKYVPRQYQMSLFLSWLDLKQVQLTVTEYIEAFEERWMQCRFVEDPRIIVGLFVHGLRLPLRNQVLKCNLAEVDEAYQHMEHPSDDPAAPIVRLIAIDHLTPYNVSWIDASSIPVKRQCRISFKATAFDESVLYDVLPMKVGSIILKPANKPAMIKPVGGGPHPEAPQPLRSSCPPSQEKDGMGHMCYDSRAINKIMVKYRFLIPRIQDLFDMMAGSTIFSKIHLRTGYHQCLMNEVVCAFIGRFVAVYFDDILIYSRSREEHLDHLRQGVAADPEKVQAITLWPTPANLHDVRSFIVETFTWIPTIEQAIQQVKLMMIQASVLRLPDFRKVFEVTCEASRVGIGGVLSQEGHPFEFFSDNLNDAKFPYSTYDKEFYAVVQTMRHWAHYDA
ncbi:uncharacterized protein LOC144702502 [Wolffia australiana]